MLCRYVHHVGIATYPYAADFRWSATLQSKVLVKNEHCDDAQDREAIRSAKTAVRMLVEAGPGTGKTEMAALRVVDLLESGLSPGQILVLSFSRSAVRTLTRRLSRVGGTEDRVLEELRHVSIRTFDSWAFRILGLLGRPASMLLARKHDDNIAELTSLIVGPQQNKVRTLIGDRQHLIVDEFQDLPGVRGELVLALLNLLAPPGHPGAGFTILGDPAQAIYGFAAIGTRQAFPTPAGYWKTVTDTYGAELDIRALKQNYRAEAPLAELSAALRNTLLSGLSDDEKLRIVRKAVAELPPTPEPASLAWLTDRAPGSRAVLTRTNGEALRVLQNLLGTEVEGPTTPVHLRAGNYAPLPPAWIAALLRRLQSPVLTRSQFGQIYKHLTQQWDATTRLNLGLPSTNATWSRLARASGAPEDATAIQISELRARLNWPDAFPDDQMIGEDHLIITTIHQSKGLEFDIVTLLDSARDETEQIDAEDGSSDPSTLEEANVHYVAITRAGRELNRWDGKGLYQAPRNWTLQNGHERLFYWRRGWINMEMGLKGDLDPFGFVDPTLHDGKAGVEKVQDFLMQNAGAIEGHKVMLRKHVSNGKAVWHVHLQEANKPGPLIGRTAPQLTFDLLNVLHGKGYALPGTIMNLRIAAVGTVTSDTEFSLDEPDRTNRLWLGVSLFGTGDFKTIKRRH